MSYYGGKNTESETCTGAETPGSKNAFVKSSALAPVSTNMMGMYLVKEHMNAHYRRLYNVKAAVDTNRRQGNVGSHFMQVKSAGASRVTSRASSRAGVRGRTAAPREAWNDERKPGGIQLLDKIDRYLKSVQKEQPKAPEPSKSRPPRPSSSISCISHKTSSCQGHKLKRRHPTPDLLDRHKEYFTKPEEPFVPRTLVRESKSRLVGSRVYHPPPPRRCSSQESIVESPRQQYSYTSDSQPFISMQVQLAAGQRKRVVPALNIQRDADHLRWIQLQARKVRAEQKLAELDMELDDSEDEESNRSSCPSRSCHCKHSNKSGYSRTKHRRERNERHSFSEVKRDRRHPLSCHSSSWVRKQLEAEEEELKCLEFINDVTNDILIRGIYTDRALKQVFQYHIGRRNDLNQNKIKVMLEKLQEDLGIESSRIWKKKSDDDFILTERYTAKPSSRDKVVHSKSCSNDWANEVSDLLDTPRSHTKEYIKETKDPTVIIEKVASLPDDKHSNLGDFIKTGQGSDHFDFADGSSRSFKNNPNGHMSTENVADGEPMPSKHGGFFSRSHSVSSGTPQSSQHNHPSRSYNASRKGDSGDDRGDDEEITNILAATALNGRVSDRSDDGEPDENSYREQNEQVYEAEGNESNYEKYLEQEGTGFESSGSEDKNYDSNSVNLQRHSNANGKSSSTNSSASSVVDDVGDDASVMGNMNSPSLKEESYHEELAESVNSSESSYDS